MGKDVHQIIPNKGDKSVEVSRVTPPSTLLGVPLIDDPINFDAKYGDVLLGDFNERIYMSAQPVEEKETEKKAHQFEDVKPGKNLLDNNVEPALNDQANEKQKEEAEKDRTEHKKRGRKPKEIQPE